MPALKALRFAPWITGPSAVGSENGMTPLQIYYDMILQLPILIFLSFFNFSGVGLFAL